MNHVQVVLCHLTTFEAFMTFLFIFSRQIMKLMNSILGDKLFNMLMKSTFYGHFVAGEDQIKIVPTLER